MAERLVVFSILNLLELRVKERSPITCAAPLALFTFL